MRTRDLICMPLRYAKKPLAKASGSNGLFYDADDTHGGLLIVLPQRIILQNADI